MRLWRLLGLCVVCAVPLSCGGSDRPPATPFVVKEIATLFRPTRGAFGPDGRLYVATLDGHLVAYTLDDDYDVVAEAAYPGLTGHAAPNVLGLAFAPHEVAGPPRLYVAHAALESDDIACADDFVPFSGAISVLEGPGFDAPIPLVTGLPSSRRIHGVNGLAFDDDGALYVVVGGLTNAGVPTCRISGLPGSPLSGAVLRLDLAAPGFDGALRYVARGSGTPIDDQLDAADADWVPVPGVELFATGIRNGFDLHWTTTGELFATDNNANVDAGDASTSATTCGPVPEALDELDRIVRGAYYGHPNRNRGRDVPRENVFAGSGAPPGAHTPELAVFPPSTNGLDEYRAAALGGTLRGALIAQQMSGATFAVHVAGGAADVEVLPIDMPSLDVLTGPGGVLVGVDFVRGHIRVAIPDPRWSRSEHGEPTLVLYDVTPWRAPGAGGAAFVLAGHGLGGGGPARVFFGEREAVLTSRSARRLHGIVPPAAGPGRIDIRVELGKRRLTLPGAFRYLPAR